MIDTSVDAGLTRVVLVDDSEDLRFMLRVRLEHLKGVKVVGEGADGVEGVDAVRHHRPHIAIVDLGMPRMDGLEAAMILRRELPELVLIALTGFQRETLAAQAREAGFDHYFVKGHEIIDLESLLEELVANGPARAELPGPAAVSPSARTTAHDPKALRGRATPHRRVP